MSEVDEGEVGALGGVEKSCGGAEWVQYRSQMNALELYHTPAIFFIFFQMKLRVLIGCLWPFCVSSRRGTSEA